MVNGPMGGFMGTPPAPAQPPQVNFTTTAESRGGFNNFLRSIPSTTAMTPIPPMGSYPMPPMGGNPMANIDIFNQPSGMMGMNQPQMNPMMQQPMQQQPMMNQPPMMMADGGGVPPRRTEIMGQDHMLSYITPEEGGILKALGGAGKPGPMGIPSFYEYGGEEEGTSDSDVSDAQEASGGYGDDNTDYSDPDSDMDYTDSYDTKEDQEADFSAASEIGQAVANAQAVSNEIQNRALAAQNKANINQAINQNKANQQSLIDAQKSLGPSKSGTTNVTTNNQPRGTDIDRDAAVQAAANTNFSNIGAKGIDQDLLGLDLTGVGLGPSINAPSIASVSPTSGPNTNADITGFGSSRDKSDFSTDIDALSNVEEQAKKGSFPNLDKIPGTLGVVTGLINAATKRGAQNTIGNISKGFAPTYDKDGNITGTTNYGIGMGQPGGLFGSGTTVDNYDVFDKTSPSLGMYDDNEIGGDDNDNPLLLRKPIIKPTEEVVDKPPNVIGGGDADVGIPTPPQSVVVDSPFTSNIGDYTPVNFSTGDLNDLIASLTGIAAPQSMAQGGVAGYAEGGLINAVDNFLASV